MCKGKRNCQCKRKVNKKPFAKRHAQRLQSNLAKGEIRREKFEGREHLIVPVVMARTDVPMNGGLIRAEDMHPQSWNGVPVTVGHPEGADVTLGSANSPAALEKWAVGKIFNASFDGVRLKGEAWVDVDKAEALHPGLVDQIVSRDMDVSTGYFSDDFAEKGTLNGKEYEVIHKALKPDHLALLPNEVGACSFEEGCGVRSNKKGTAMKVKEALRVLANALLGQERKTPVKPKAKAKVHERGDDDDDRQIRADLISHEDSPFVPDDEMALSMLSKDTLAKMRDSFIPKAQEGDEEEESSTNEDDEEKDDTTSNEDDESEDDTTSNEDGEDEKPKEQKGKKNASPAPKANGKGKPVKKNCTGSSALSDEDKAALAFAKTHLAKEREGLEAKVVANTKFTAEQVKKFDLDTLKTMVESFDVAPDYSGRAVPKTHDLKDAPESVKAMSSTSYLDTIRNSKKKEAA